MNVPLQAFSSDTTAMYTIDSSNKWSWACGCVDLCSKFFFAPNISFSNDEILVNKTYKETPIQSSSIVNTDHGRNHLSNLNKNYLRNIRAFISSGIPGHSTDNRECEFFWGNWKRECYYKMKESEKTIENIRKKFNEYVWWYNFVRPQKCLEGLTPYKYLLKKMDENNMELNELRSELIRLFKQYDIITISGSPLFWA
jgi:transposase InsO family protein